MKEHNREYLAVVKDLIKSRKNYLKKSAKTKSLKITTLKKEYQAEFKKTKNNYKVIKQKFNSEITEVKKVMNFEKENNLQHQLKIAILKKEYQDLLAKNKNERKVLKNDFNNNVVFAKSLWKSVKLRHE